MLGIQCFAGHKRTQRFINILNLKTYQSTECPISGDSPGGKHTLVILYEYFNINSFIIVQATLAPSIESIFFKCPSTSEEFAPILAS